MSKNNKYTYLVTMPAKSYFNDGYGTYFDYDILNNPEGYNEKDMLDSFWGFYGSDKWDERSRYTSKQVIHKLISNYGYTFSHIRRNGVRNNYVFIELEVTTNALGNHLQDILDCISNEFSSATQGCGIYRSAAKYKLCGWQELDPKKLVACEHTRSKRLEVMKDKDGTILEVRECSKCKQLFKRHIH